MEHAYYQNEIDLEQEYSQRVLVFKCRLTWEQKKRLWFMALYASKCFKGTRKQFDQFCNKYFPNEIITPYLVYYDEEKVSRVDSTVSGFKDCRDFVGIDRNIIQKPISENAKRNQEYRYLKSSFR